MHDSEQREPGLIYAQNTKFRLGNRKWIKKWDMLKQKDSNQVLNMLGINADGCREAKRGSESMGAKKCPVPFVKSYRIYRGTTLLFP